MLVVVGEPAGAATTWKGSDRAAGLKTASTKARAVVKRGWDDFMEASCGVVFGSWQKRRPTGGQLCAPLLSESPRDSYTPRERFFMSLSRAKVHPQRLRWAIHS